MSRLVIVILLMINAQLLVSAASLFGQRYADESLMRKKARESEVIRKMLNEDHPNRNGKISESTDT